METQKLNHLLKISASSGRAKIQTLTLNSFALEPISHTDSVGRVQHLGKALLL